MKALLSAIIYFPCATECVLPGSLFCVRSSLYTKKIYNQKSKYLSGFPALRSSNSELCDIRLSPSYTDI